VTPGQSVAHEKSESMRMRMPEKMNSQIPILALTSMSGPDQVWFASGYDSFEEMEKQDRALEDSAAYGADPMHRGHSRREFLAYSK
jgi:hypothetical protein